MKKPFNPLTKYKNIYYTNFWLILCPDGKARYPLWVPWDRLAIPEFPTILDFFVIKKKAMEEIRYRERKNLCPCGETKGHYLKKLTIKEKGVSS